MNLTITCPNTEFCDVNFTTTTDTLVEEASNTAADEWGVDSCRIDLNYGGALLPSNSKIVSHGVSVDSQLVASLIQIFRLDHFKDPVKAKVIKPIFKDEPNKILYLDSPTFTTDGSIDVDCLLLPENVKSIEWCNPKPSITSVADSFLFESDHTHMRLTSVDLTGLCYVTTIKDSFLKNCDSLTHLDMSSLCNVTSIGTEFLHGCSALETIDLSKFSKLTEIPDAFLCDNTSLTNIDISGLSNITKIGHSFLSDCEFLQTIDISCLTKVTSIGEYFMCNAGLMEIDLSSLSNVSLLDSSFLFNCPGLLDVPEITQFIKSKSKRKVESMDSQPRIFQMPDTNSFKSV